MDQKLKGIPASLSESLLGNQTVTGGGRNALIGNCLFLLTPRYLQSLGFARPVEGRRELSRPGDGDDGGDGEVLGAAAAPGRTAGRGR